MAAFLPVCQSAEPPLSILLVSDNVVYLQSFAEDLKLRIRGGASQLKVYTCESITQVLKASETPEVDFVVFFVNEKRFNAINEIELSISKLERSFLLDRICLICDNASGCGSFQPKIHSLKIKYQLHVLWADIQAEPSLLSKRLVNLVSAVCGLHSGFPIITHKAWHGKFSEEVDFQSASTEVNETF